jgi:glutamate--cysteine ligase
MSMRAHIWKHTAPERSGLIPGVFNESFNFEKYVDYALSVPLLFILRNDRWIATKGLDFPTFMEKGFDGIEATIEDWHLHLTTIFTDSRLKNYLEIRSFDCQKMELGLAAPALVKGLFYDKLASEAAWEFVADLTQGERTELAAEAAKKGLHAELRKESLFQIASKLIYVADEGLKRLVSKGMANENAFMYLRPIKTLVNKGLMPADILLGCFDYSLNGREKAQRIID